MKTTSSIKKRKKKIITMGLAVGAASVLGYFTWQYFNHRKKIGNGGANDSVNPFADDVASSQTVKVAPPLPKRKETVPVRFSSQLVKMQFPLKKGSKGEKVKQLQNALIKKHGKTILPRFGADGDFGSETVEALTKLGLPVTISESAFNVIVGETSSGTLTVGKELFNAVSLRDFTKTLSVLARITSPQDYTAANDDFKKGRLNDGVRQTIVNGLLNTFTTKQQKEKIRYELLRIGLQYDGSKWSLPSLDGLPLITLVPTTVWINAQRGVRVPAQMVLGNEITRRLDYTLFENRGRYFLVPTHCVKQL
jgi:peptidoglycan hydrolase-like protein with peptidoglycan-binding domain